MSGGDGQEVKQGAPEGVPEGGEDMRAALNSLNAGAAQEESGGEGGQGQDASPSKDAVKDAEETATLVVGGMAELVAVKWGVGLLPETQKRGVEKVGACLAKWGAKIPMVAKWREEIEAAVWLGSTGYGIYMAVQAQKAAEQKGGEDADK